MNFILLLLQLLPYLPTILKVVERIHPAAKQGNEKLKTAVGIISAVVPEVVGHLQNEPANKSKLESLISTVVVGLNAADSWNNNNNQIDQAPPP